MKLNLFALCCGLASAAVAAPLTETTAVHTKADLTAPTIAHLKAGTNPVAVVDPNPATPAGWMAVELPGPFEGYVAPNALTKSLDVRPGSTVHLAPKADAPVLTATELGDKIEITGLRGKWTQIRLEKKIVGYIQQSRAGSAAPVASSPTAPTTTPQPAGPGIVSGSVTAAGQAAPMSPSGNRDSVGIPRMLQGRFVSTKRPFAPKRPYDYQINDERGARVAYIDVSKLLLTEQIDKYTGHTVIISGVARNVPELNAIVLEAESLQLK